MLFTEADPNFINPARVSPLKLGKQTAAGASGSQRLLYNGRIAVCVSAVFCTESVVVSAGRISSKTERTRKWISGIFHNQEWERFEGVMCLVFGEEVMYAQISPKKAIAFQSVISPESASGSKGEHMTCVFDDLITDSHVPLRCRCSIQQRCSTRYVQSDHRQVAQSIQRQGQARLVQVESSHRSQRVSCVNSLSTAKSSCTKS
jgi:hypothetical protein